MKLEYCVIGSSAMEAQGIDINRSPVDMDVVCNWKTANNLVKWMKSFKGNAVVYYPLTEDKCVMKVVNDDYKFIAEFDLSYQDNDHNGKLMELVINDPFTVTTNNTHGDGTEIFKHYASKDVLYMLKMSHRFKKNSPHFLKTMNDIILLRKNGAVIRDEHEEFYNERVKLTYDYKHPSLKRNKDEFFNPNEGVKYVYQHDNLHEIVKLYDRPAYTYFKPANSEVWCDKDMFENCEHHIKLAAVYEESAVLGLERSVIPFGTDADKAFKMALEKCCTGITSGWFREFCWDNYYQVVELYERLRSDYGKNYVDDFNKGVIDGRARLVN